MEENKIYHGEFNQIGKLWKRFIAYMVDGFILAVPALIIFFGFSFIFGSEAFSSFKEPENIKLGILIQIIAPAILASAISLIYFTYFIGKTGQSPGKKSMGLKVVNSDGSVLGYKRAFFRYLFFILYELPIIGAIISIISLIMAVIDRERRTLHDRICKTFVVGKKEEDAIKKVVEEGKPRIAGASIFALFLSIFCIVIPVLGQLVCFYVCGRVLYDIKQSKGLLKGKSLAISGIIISIGYLMFFLYIILFIMPSSKR